MKILQLAYRVTPDMVTRTTDLFTLTRQAFVDDEFCYSALLAQEGLTESHIRNNLNCKAKLYGFTKKNVRGFGVGVIKTLGQFIENDGFDVVITHRYKASYYIQILALLGKVKSALYVYHGLHQMKGWKKNILLKLSGFRCSYRVVAVSDAVRRDLINSGVSEDKVVLIRNAIDVAATRKAQFPRTEALERLKLDPQRRYVGSLGSVREVKGHKFLVEAFAGIAGHFPNHDILIMGGGPLEKDLREQAKALGIEHRLHITGFLQDAFKYLKALDVFVMPSLREGLPMAMLEAMAAGVPVVASKVGGIPEVLEDEDTLLEVGDVTGVALIVSRVLSDREYHKKLSIDMKRILEGRFDFTVYAESFKSTASSVASE
jgi:glycosyltransferase involved in cell wall biosynthesis